MRLWRFDGFFKDVHGVSFASMTFDKDFDDVLSHVFFGPTRLFLTRQTNWVCWAGRQASQRSGLHHTVTCKACDRTKAERRSIRSAQHQTCTKWLISVCVLWKRKGTVSEQFTFSPCHFIIHSSFWLFISLLLFHALLFYSSPQTLCSLTVFLCNCCFLVRLLLSSHVLVFKKSSKSLSCCASTFRDLFYLIA